MWKLSGLCLLLAALSRAVDGVETTVYFTNGSELPLDVKPSYSEPIINILWKFNGNLLAEWVHEKVPLELYSTFQGRAELDKKNARLVIKRMTKADAGKYTVGINSKVHEESYDAQWVERVGEPVVLIQPLTCSHESKECNARCEADTIEAGPVTYSWKFGDKEWKVSEKDIEINQTDHAHDKTITCRISNPVSEQVSEAIKNPLYYNNIGTIVVIVMTILLLVCVVVLIFLLWKRKKFCFKTQKTQNSTQPDPIPNQPNPTPNKRDPTPTLNTPDPTPTLNTPAPTTPVPEKDPSDPAAEERVPLRKLQDRKETV